MINLEPAYEQHGYHHGGGRFTAAQVRRASWWSMPGGACAGIGYGAHGVWQWFRACGVFTATGSSLQPFAWPSAMTFRGADDVALLASLLRTHRLDRLSADQNLLDPNHSEVEGRVIAAGVRAASGADGDLMAVYLPFAHRVRLRRDLTGFAATGWDLEDRVPVMPVLTADAGAPRSSRPTSAATCW